MSNVLFLDFDGPLFPDRIIRFHPDNSRPYPGALTVDSPLVAGELTYWKMDPVAVEMLNQLYSLHPFDTVVSSSWKNFCSISFIEELFQINGLKLHFHNDWFTPRVSMRARRLDEIISWIDDHPDTNALIIDDPWSGSCVSNLEQDYDRYSREITDKIKRNNLIIVDPTLGLDESHFRRMLEVVRKWSGVTQEQINEEKRKEDILLKSMIF